MRKFAIFTLLFLGLNLHAAKINGVVALVNNEPITAYELQAMKKQTGGNDRAALEALISQKLQNAEIKRLGIMVSPLELSNATNEVAKQNNMSLEQLQKAVVRSGDTWDGFQKKLENDIKARKFYERVFSDVDSKATRENVMAFYQANPQLFSSFNSVNAVRYIAKTEAALKAIQQKGPNSARNSSNLMVQNINIPKSQMNKQIMQFFASIPEGAFSRIVRNQYGDYEMFYVSKKGGLKVAEFSEVEQEALNMYVAQNRQKFMETYFDKLRAKAVVEMIDAPAEVKSKK